ncbi:MAG TPA: replicative DNA helicase [Spirochaetia bacterium]|nr:replicative DNA helicase [Spirochaetia bacterium]
MSGVVSDSGLKDAVPSHDEEAEVATLGAVLIDPEGLPTVMPLLRPEDFYRGAHQRIYEAVLALFDRGQSIDLITLSDELRTRGTLELCGGRAYISRLTSAVPTSANVEYYARMVQASSIRRGLARVSQEIISRAHDERSDISAILEDAERRIFEISDRNQTGTYLPAKDVVKQTFEAIERHYHSKTEYTGIPSGFKDLDRLTMGFQDSEFIVIGARPSVGKTAFALTIAANMAIRQKVPVGFFSLEMSSMAIMQRLLSMEARIDSQRMRAGMLSPADFSRLTEAASSFYEAPLYISDYPDLKILDLRAQARRMKSKHNVRIVFVDYITLIGSENTEQPRHEQIAEISRSLKALARELHLPIIALSQVRRETEGKKPTLADLRESGSIEQDADMVIFIHTEDLKQEQREIAVAKQRNGPVDDLQLSFVARYTKFEELERRG